MSRFINMSGVLGALSVSAALLVDSATVAATIPDRLKHIIPETQNVAFRGTVLGNGSTWGTLSYLVDGQRRSRSANAGLLAAGVGLNNLDLSTLNGFVGGAWQPKSESDSSIVKGISGRTLHADFSQTFWVSVWDGTYTKAVKVRVYDDNVAGDVFYHVEKAGYTSNQADVGLDFDTITYNAGTIANSAVENGYGLAKLSVRSNDGQSYDVSPAYGRSTHVRTNRSAADALLVDFTEGGAVSQVNLWRVTDCCQTRLGPIIVELYNGNDLTHSFTVQQSDFSGALSTDQSYATVRFATVLATRARIRSVNPTQHQLALTEFQVFAAPAPALLGLMGLGLVGVAAAARRRKKVA